MISIPARWSVAARCALVLLLMVGANSCGKSPQAKKTKQIKCDSDVDVDVAKPGNGVKKQAVYVCEGDAFTWNVPSGHHFAVVFNAGSPFTASSFSDQNPTATAQPQYGALTVYKYSITVNSNPPVDPQVVGGGN